jgi:hypothetical protein
VAADDTRGGPRVNRAAGPVIRWHAPGSDLAGYGFVGSRFTRRVHALPAESGPPPRAPTRPSVRGPGPPRQAADDQPGSRAGALRPGGREEHRREGQGRSRSRILGLDAESSGRRRGLGHVFRAARSVKWDRACPGTGWRLRQTPPQGGSGTAAVGGSESPASRRRRSMKSAP